MIRLANLADIPEIVALGEEFHTEDPWSGLFTFDAESFAESARSLIEGGAIFLSGHGLIGLRACPCIYNRAQQVVVELFFWAPDGRGTELRKAAERWASGVLILGAHEPADPRIEHWYRRAGYVPIGRQYAKVI